MSTSINTITIDQALRDRQLLGAALGRPDSWSAWLVALKASFGIELNRVERRTFASIAGDRTPPSEKVRELWAIVGRGGGKSRMAAAIGVYLACFVQHSLDPGEVGNVLILAANRDQAHIVFNYAYAFLQKSRILRRMIRNRTASEIQLTNNINIAVHANSFRSIRGRSLVAVVFDECAIWRDDTSANPDLEVYRACKPSLIRCNGMLVTISTPYRKGGLLYSQFSEHFGVDDDGVLVVKGPTTAFNPTIEQAKIARELLADPEGARSEWEAEFRSDISSLFNEQVIEDAVDHARPLELPPRSGLKYHCFADASAGRSDSFSVTIGHTVGARDEASWVGDVVRGRVAPFNPRDTAQEYAELARSYGIHKIVGDNFAGEWVAQAFADAGIQYETCKLTKSQLYLESVSSFNRGAARIPNHELLLRELRGLERRVHRSGRDSVDHPRHGSDDLANAVCGCLYLGMHEAHAPRASWGTYNPCGNDPSVHYHDDEPERSRIRIERISEQEDLRRRGLL